MRKIPDKENETLTVNLMYGTYSDVLFILFPFLVIALQRLWNNEGVEVLRHPDLSVAAAIIAGMSVGKFVIGLISDVRVSQYRERIVFFIAVTLFFVLGPSLMLITMMVGAEEVPKFVVFVQPVLLIVAISIYSIAIGVSKMINTLEEEEGQSDDDSLVSGDDSSPEPLKIKSQDQSRV
ncbi:MAG: hypothetical protein CSA52_02755 [Gammaproteobacteria bacterium]|nr:MAG: hypothetical protein CSB48_04425 [Pseudomonadota bacterium]PIE38320.1 MAG: hypothetical protein CSA52_02755 [Gammaproteobacteria bacterium]